jgi:hypothetical protein
MVLLARRKMELPKKVVELVNDAKRLKSRVTRAALMLLAA